MNKIHAYSPSNEDLKEVQFKSNVTFLHKIDFLFNLSSRQLCALAFNQEGNCCDVILIRISDEGVATFEIGGMVPLFSRKVPQACTPLNSCDGFFLQQEYQLHRVFINKYNQKPFVFKAEREFDQLCVASDRLYAMKCENQAFQKIIEIMWISVDSTNPNEEWKVT